MNRIFLNQWLAPSIAAIPLIFPALTLNAQDIEEVVVTGSYIRGIPADAPLPVTTLNREDLALEGSPTALDLIKGLSFSQGADGETDQFQAGAGADRATVNIRGLGPSRSLVLVNGRRTTWSPGAIGAQAQLLVDVNMMPAMAIGRIEMLRDGAAATYGSDAIAGVMNFITRSDFDGFEINASHKGIDGSDGDSEFGFIWGTDFMDGRAHVMTSASYIDRSLLRISSRDWALLPYEESTRGGWSTVGRPALFLPNAAWNTPLRQGVQASNGAFAAVLATSIVDPRCEDLGGAHTMAGVAGNTAGGFCRFQYTAFANLIEDAQRWQWWTEASFELSDTTTLNTELLITESDVPGWNTSPSYPPNRLVDENRTILANNPGLIDMARLYPDLYGDFAACDEAYCRYAGDGGPQDAAGIPTAWQESGWVYGRAYGQDGPTREHQLISEVMRFAASLEGELDDLGWQLALTYSESDRSAASGDVMVYRDARGRLGLAGDACEASVPNEYNDAGQLEFSLATLQANAGQGSCRYWIPFSVGMRGADPLVRNAIGANPDFNPALNNRDVRDYMLTEGAAVGNTSLLTLDAILTGEFAGIDFGAGSLAYAAGLQYRDETYNSRTTGFYDGERYPCAAGPEITDCTSGRTGLFGFLPPGFPIDADRDVWAIFAEFQLPLTDSLEAQLAIRHENYGGNTGSTTDPKVAFKWQLNDSIGLRASFGSTFRGPTLNQTVEANSSNSLQFVGVTGAFKRIDTRGNPNLKPEEANTINVGLLVDHDGLLTNSDNFLMTLDYWSYDFTDPLVTEPFQNLVGIACPPPANVCLEGPEYPYFDRLVFGSTSTNATDLEIINVNIVNGPDYQTDGFDFTFRYGLDAGPGYLTWDLTGTKIQSFDIGSWVFGEEYDALGRLNYRTSLARTLVDWKGRTSFNYAWEDWNVRWITNAINEYKYLGAAPQTCGEDCIVPSHVTHDLHVTYNLLDDQLTITASLLNLEDEDPPHMSREHNYDAFTHNPFGRMWRLGLTYRL